MTVDRAVAYQAVSTVALRVGTRRASDPFGPSAFSELSEKIAHLTGMLSAEPWCSKTMQERMDFVVSMLQHGARAEARSLTMPQMSTLALADKSDERKFKSGAGSVPKHYQHRVAPAQAQASYRMLKAAVLARLAQGGEASDLDALQIALTGVEIKQDGSCEAARWAPMLHMMAERRGWFAWLTGGPS